MKSFEEKMVEHRNALQTMERQMQSEYDKSILLLSGGALGVSMTFLKDVVIKQGIQGGGFLLAAWLCWCFSVTCTLSSYFTSAQALRRAVKQIDDKLAYLQSPGGRFNQITITLNIVAGLLFLFGVVFVIVFVANNRP